MSNQIKLKWSIVNMNRLVSNGFIINIDWSCIALADSAAGVFYGGQTKYENNPNNTNFIPYEDLTEEIVLGWVFDSIGEDKDEIENTLTSKVQKQLNSLVVNGLPWSKYQE